jgi:diguanylate cyclase (GGDEF)-like protein/PAS domain S-box-containing protein
MLTLDEIVAVSERLTACGHWLIDLADDTLVWSDQIYHIHGLSPQEPQPDVDTAIAYYLEADQQRIRERLAHTRRHGEGFDFVGRIQRRDGQIRSIRSLGERIDGSGDHPGHLVGVFRDITEELSAQRHQERVVRALANTAEGIIMTDPERRLTWCNAAVERLTGYSLDELQGHQPGDCFQGPDTDPGTVAYMTQQLAAEKGFIVEILNYHRDGQPYWIRLSVHPDRSDDGTLVGFTAIQSDITEEKTIRENLEREIERRSKLEAELRYLSSHDALSGMPNRRHFFEQTDRELARCRRHTQPLSLILFDLDDFKSVNDVHGHAAGDAVIRAVGELFSRIQRRYDFVARIGGEEFTVVLPETDLDGAVTVAERLRRELERMPIPESGDSVSVTASLGVTEARPTTDNVETFLARADRALYSAKRSGRNCIAIENPGQETD